MIRTYGTIQFDQENGYGKGSELSIYYNLNSKYIEKPDFKLFETKYVNQVVSRTPWTGICSYLRSKSTPKSFKNFTNK